jgi:hypothetical protein
MTEQSASRASNGVDTEALIGARGAFAQVPEAGVFTSRGDGSWIYRT